MAEMLISSERYTHDAGGLKTLVDTLLERAATETINGEIVALIVPSANRVASGEVAARVFKTLTGRVYDTVILVTATPDTTFGRMTICSRDVYSSPLGDMPVNDRIRNELCDEDDDIFISDQGHFGEDGIGVQLPFLKSVIGDFSVVPIVMGDDSPNFCRELGTAISEVMYGHSTLLVGMVDVLGGDDDTARDFIRLFEHRDVSRMMSLIRSERFPIRGGGPLVASMIVAANRGATRSTIFGIDLPEDGSPGRFGAVLWKE